MGPPFIGGKHCWSRGDDDEDDGRAKFGCVPAEAMVHVETSRAESKAPADRDDCLEPNPPVGTAASAAHC